MQAKNYNFKRTQILVARMSVKRYDTNFTKVMELKILHWPQEGSIRD